ncbi:MAG: serine acetyltransferase [Candidatus Azobacteroides sp.]|nr:serine acetyltransferase [Candidatus Azobacteroides sp.]
MNLQELINKSVRELTDVHHSKYRYIPMYDKQLPSAQTLKEIIEVIREIVFPGYFGNPSVTENTVRYHAGVNTEKLYYLLFEQIYRALAFESNDANTPTIAKEKTFFFIERLPDIKRLLSTDVKAIYDNDPAAKSFGEIIFCYPAIKALLNHRVAHELYLSEIPLIPRIVTEMAHAETGIDIHPGATIGEYFSIDHGTGIVIGQTAVIGNHVCLYQGVTLGAKKFVLDEAGNPMDLPRHPILEDNVTVYSNASILGRITIGKGTIIGGNVWLTYSVPPNSRIIQTKAVEDKFVDGLGI